MARSIRFATWTLATLAALAAACGGETPPPAPPPPPPPPSATASASTAPVAPVASAAPAPAPEPPKPAPPVAVVKFTGLAAPESVLYDADNDRYLVSNINGKPADKDNNGFISVLAPDGTVTTLKWIEGGKKGVKLDGPKGLALVKGVLYVADISSVRMFDAKTGAPKGSIAIPGATFLNDVAAGPDGKVYVSDSGIKFGATGPEGTGTDAVYAIDKGKAKAIAKGADLKRPNGVAWSDKGLLVVTFGGNEIYRLDDKGAKQDVTTTPKGGLDGLIVLGDDLLVTSWEGSAIYKGKLGGTFDTVLSDQTSPADIGYDTKRGRLLLPHLSQDTVEVYEIK
jgi:sugar lactone lactonase YvrE